MIELMIKAKGFLDANSGFNEIELTDTEGNKVKLVRYTPIPSIVYSYPEHWQYNPAIPPGQLY